MIFPNFILKISLKIKKKIIVIFCFFSLIISKNKKLKIEKKENKIKLDKKIKIIKNKNKLIIDKKKKKYKKKIIINKKKIKFFNSNKKKNKNYLNSKYYVFLNKKNKKVKKINKLSLETYMIGSVYGEIFSHWPKISIKTQYLINKFYLNKKIIKNKNKIYNIKTNEYDQNYINNYKIKKKIINSIKKEKNKTNIFNNSFTYSAICSGKKQKKNKKKCKYCYFSKKWKKESKINIEIETIFYLPKKKKLIFKKKKKNSFISRLKIRKIKKLKSKKLEKIVKINKEILIFGKGYGNFKGFCQHGIKQITKKGYNYKNIKKFYN